MVQSAEALSVIIFDDNSVSLYRDLAKEAADQSGWQADVFVNPHEANEALCVSTSALVTALGTRGSMFVNRPALPLIDKSNKLSIPRALLSGHPVAGDFIRQNMPDVLVPKTEPELIVERLAAWFLQLTEIQ